jgi:hypothetical protein
LAGRTEYEALPALRPPTVPRLRTSVPDCPAVVEVVKPGSRAQHSRVERLLWADKTVMFRVFAVVRAMDARKGTSVEMRILTIYGLIWD